MQAHKTAIIGSGPAGLTAAIYLGRADLQPVVYAGSIFGGQLMITTDVDNFPGFDEGILGPDLMDKMIKQAKKFGADIRYKDVTRVDFFQKPFKIYSGSGENETMEEYDSVIVATGASSKNLGLEGEQQLTGRGISYCATCDGAFFKGKEIAVIGGGDSAMEEALFLTKFASKIYLIHRRNTYRASKIMQAKVVENEKIVRIYNSVINRLEGSEKLEGAYLKNIETNEEQHLDLSGIFIAIGHTPNTEIFKGQLDMDDHGYIIKTEHTATNIPGIFTAGDVNDLRYKQAITAAGQGCSAAIDVEKYLEGIA